MSHQDKTLGDSTELNQLAVEVRSMAESDLMERNAINYELRELSLIHEEAYQITAEEIKRRNGGRMLK